MTDETITLETAAREAIESAQSADTIEALRKTSPYAYSVASSLSSILVVDERDAGGTDFLNRNGINPGDITVVSTAKRWFGGVEESALQGNLGALVRIGWTVPSDILGSLYVTPVIEMADEGIDWMSIPDSRAIAIGMAVEEALKARDQQTVISTFEGSTAPSAWSRVWENTQSLWQEGEFLEAIGTLLSGSVAWVAGKAETLFFGATEAITNDGLTRADATIGNEVKSEAAYLIETLSGKEIDLGNGETFTITPGLARDMFGLEDGKLKDMPIHLANNPQQTERAEATRRYIRETSPTLPQRLADSFREHPVATSLGIGAAVAAHTPIIEEGIRAAKAAPEAARLAYHTVSNAPTQLGTQWNATVAAFRSGNFTPQLSALGRSALDTPLRFSDAVGRPVGAVAAAPFEYAANREYSRFTGASLKLLGYGSGGLLLSTGVLGLDEVIRDGMHNGWTLGHTTDAAAYSAQTAGGAAVGWATYADAFRQGALSKTGEAFRFVGNRVVPIGATGYTGYLTYDHLSRGEYGAAAVDGTLTAASGALLTQTGRTAATWTFGKALAGARAGFVAGAKPTPAAWATVIGGTALGFLFPNQAEAAANAIHDNTIGAMQRARHDTMVKRWGEGGMQAYEEIISNLPTGELPFGAMGNYKLQAVAEAKTTLVTLLEQTPENPSQEEIKAVNEAVKALSENAYAYIDYQIADLHGDQVLSQVRRDISNVVDAKLRTQDIQGETREERRAAVNTARETILSDAQAFIPMLAPYEYVLKDITANESIPQARVAEETPQQAPTPAPQTTEDFLALLKNEDALFDALPDAHDFDRYSHDLNTLISFRVALEMQEEMLRTKQIAAPADQLAIMESERLIDEAGERLWDQLTAALDNEKLLEEIAAIQAGTLITQQPAQQPKAPAPLPLDMGEAVPLVGCELEACRPGTEIRGQVASAALAAVGDVAPENVVMIGNAMYHMGEPVAGASHILPQTEQVAMAVAP